MYQERRSFLKLATHGLGVLFAAILGIPALLYALDPRNRVKPPSDFRAVDGIRKSELVLNAPKQGTIRALRQDAWTLHPNDVIGRVWVLKFGEGDRDFRVFTTICPHLGCSINADGDENGGFTCPCHGAEFAADGTRWERANYQNPAPRDMDTLEWQWQGEGLMVKYQNFRQGEQAKIVKT